MSDENFTFTTPPSLDAIAAMAEIALTQIPEVLRRHVEGVILRVDDFPDAEVEAEMELDSPFDLLGLYHGVALPNQSLMDGVPHVPMVFLYRRPILEYWCETGEDLTHVIRHVLIHEIGHHFGFSDEDMEALEAQAGS
jgi:predicted Zn-dependent protease with MMP-like domain